MGFPSTCSAASRADAALNFCTDSSIHAALPSEFAMEIGIEPAGAGWVIGVGDGCALVLVPPVTSFMATISANTPAAAQIQIGFPSIAWLLPSGRSFVVSAR